MRVLLITSLLSAVSFGAEAPKQAISIFPPPSKPDNASCLIPATFPGYAFEESSFVYYAGNKTHPNKFSQNLIKAITDKTKTGPVIRVGGTSLDHATYSPTLSDPIYNPDPSSGIPKHLKIGPSFFNHFTNFPDAKYVIDIPMFHNNLSNSLLFAEAANRVIGPSNIYAWEIGNEPDNYGNAGADWDEEQFGEKWGNWSEAISKRLNVSVNSQTYQAVALSSQTGVSGTPGGGADSWKIGQIFKQGGMEKYKQRMKTISMHYYQIKANETSDLQADLMNHDEVVKGTAFIKTALQNLTAFGVDVPIVLGEVGNTLGNGSSGINLEGVLGSALWQVDFSLYTMFLGVRGISMQSGIKFPFALWHPQYNNTAGAVLPAFYAQIFAAEFLGSKGNVTVANIDLGVPHTSAYAAYEGTHLARLAIVNLELWDGHQESQQERHTRQILLHIPTGTDSVSVKKLTSPAGGMARSSDQITWGGMQWTYNNEGRGEMVGSGAERLTVKNDTVQLSINASEATMVFF
ncbi:hypothetical protein BDV26DRAFT_276305 [Aspergillus bertholletiae]|uniref:Beta-glucuronidase C-terminal domain-containing protein n=1 Tax=Aspergillus bertholletiae TaxID=1226010 RepID=A0A5N7ARF3_9EURO|nr:hypothetical protein BDV26DRAFT_276305 [Aspergillus bertholletiae]